MNHKQLVQQMAEMKAQLEKYQSELTNLRSQVTNYENVEAPSPVAATTSRRKLLKRMALAGIGGVGAMGLAAATNPNYTVLAENTADNAIEAVGGPGGYGLKAAGGMAPLFLVGYNVTDNVTGAPTSGTHQPGELFVDKAGNLFYCATGGTPGTWRRVSGNNTAGAFVPLNASERFIDTRFPLQVGPAPATPGRLAANTEKTYKITGRDGVSGDPSLQIPIGATAIVISIGVVNPDAGGFLQAWKAGAIAPTTTVLSWPSSGLFRTGATLALPDTGQITVKSSVGTDFNLDVTGYYI